MDMKQRIFLAPLLGGTLAMLGIAAACGSHELTSENQNDPNTGTVAQALSTTSIAPSSGPQGTSILVSGAGFAVGEAVTIKFDGTTVGTTTATNGTFATVVEAPNPKANGTYTIASTGNMGSSASSSFAVNTTTPAWKLARSASAFDGIPNSLRHSPADATGNRLYVATDIGAYMTDNANTPASLTFSNITGAIDNPNGIAVEVSGGMKGGVFFSSKLVDAGAHHLYRSQDAGADWAVVTPNPDMEVQGWKIFYSLGTHLIGGTQGGNATVEKATSAYSTYPNQPPATLGAGCTVTSIDGSSTTNVLAASYGAGTSSCGIYRSTDGSGATFSARNGTIGTTDLKAMRAVASDPTSATTFYAGSDAGSGSVLYKTTDSGATWSAFASGLSGKKVYVIAVNASGVPYVGTDAGIYKWNGTTFVQSGLNVTGSRVTSISFSPADANKIFVGLNARKSLWYTTTGG